MSMIEILKTLVITVSLFVMAPLIGIGLSVLVGLALIGLPLYGLLVYLGLVRDSWIERKP